MAASDQNAEVERVNPWAPRVRADPSPLRAAARPGLQPGTFARLPPQVEALPRREREVAAILYVRGSMTAKAVHDLLPRDLSYSALRSMLMRLCRKKVLQRRKLTGSHDARDRRIPYVYSPAITEEIVRRRALMQLAQDYFDGSLTLVFRAVNEALEARSGTSGSGAGGSMRSAA